MEASQEFRGGGEIATGPEEIIQPVNVDPAIVTAQAIANKKDNGHGAHLKRTNIFYGFTPEQISQVLDYFVEQDKEYSKRLIGLKHGLDGKEPLTNAQMAELAGCAVGTMASRLARIYAAIDLDIRLAAVGPIPPPDEMPSGQDAADPEKTSGEPEIDEAVYFIGGPFARLSDAVAREVVKGTVGLNSVEQLAVSRRHGLSGEAQTLQQIANDHNVPLKRVQQVYDSAINKIKNSGLIDQAMASN